MRTIRLLSLTLLGLLCVTPAHVVRADDDSDRASILRDIESRLRDIHDKVRSVRDASSTGYLDDARDKANEVKELAKRLASVKGSDDKAGKIAEKYPDDVENFKEALRGLKLMKDAELALKNDELKDKCRDGVSKMKDEIGRYVDKNDPEGLEKLPEAADRIAEPLAKKLDAADQLTREGMREWREQARRFSGSDGWGDVNSDMRDGADSVRDNWIRRMEEAHKECDDVVKGRKSEMVEKAIGKLGDSATVRKALIQQMNEQLEKIADLLDGVVDQSDLSRVAQARDLADELEKLVDKLKDVRGEDKNAREIADKWPDQVKRYRESAMALIDLKSSQHVLDKGPSSCAEQEVALEKEIAEAKKKIDDEPDADDKLERMAKELGDTYEKKLENAEQRRESMEKWRDQVKKFEFDTGKWAKVRERMHNGADKVYASFVKVHEETKSACAKLKLGEKHPMVVAGLKELRDRKGTADHELENLKKDLEEWKKHVDSYRKEYMVDADKMRQAMCDEEEYQPKEQWQSNDRLENEAKNIASSLQPVWQELDNSAEALRLRAIELKKYGGKIRDEAEKIRDKIAKAKRSLFNLSQGILKGANNPKLRARMKAGDDLHKSMQSSTCSSGAEVEIDGGRGRIDCVVVQNDKCNVIEIKSNGKGGESQGRTQLRRYRDYLDSADGKTLVGERNGKIWNECMDKTDPDHWKPRIADYQLMTYSFCPIGQEDISDPFPANLDD